MDTRAWVYRAETEGVDRLVDGHEPECIGFSAEFADQCDCRIIRILVIGILQDERVKADGHGYGTESDCVCGRNFATVRGLREHLTKARR